MNVLLALIGNFNLRIKLQTERKNTASTQQKKHREKQREKQREKEQITTKLTLLSEKTGDFYCWPVRPVFLSEIHITQTDASLDL